MKPAIRVKIEFKNLIAAETVRDWLINQYVENELSTLIESQRPRVYIDEFDNDKIILDLLLRFKTITVRNRVILALKEKAIESGVLQYINQIRIYKHSCGHDTTSPIRCTEEVYYSWQ